MASTRRANKLLELATCLVRVENDLALRRAEFARLVNVESRTVADCHVQATKLLEVAAGIVELEDKLALQRSEFDRSVKVDGSDVGDDGAPMQPCFPMRPLARASSLPTRVQSVVDLSSRPLSAHDIAAQVNAPIDSVRAALSKLHARNTVRRDQPGLYSSNVGGHRKAAGEDD